jgi:hypothetical protein
MIVLPQVLTLAIYFMKDKEQLRRRTVPFCVWFSMSFLLASDVATLF